MKKYVFFLHCLFWLAIPFTLIFIVWAYQFTVFGSEKFAKSYFTLFSESVILSSVIVAIGAPVFYLTSKGILPALLGARKRIARALIFILLVAVIPGLLLIIFSFFSFAVGLFFNFFLLTGYLTIVPFMLLGAFTAIFKKWTNAGKEMVQLENKNIKTELELLRSQINPHFLFNTINNIDSLIQKDPASASRYLNELSELLRFMIYETRSESIPLEKEISYIQKYINLQRMRSVNSGFIHFSIAGEISSQKIAPMIFIPFIENAFKHVSDKTENKAIQLSFDICAATIQFTCINNYKEQNNKSTPMNGVGIPLIRQRLDLIYKDRYELETSTNHHQYQVKLKIQLDAD